MNKETIRNRLLDHGITKIRFEWYSDWGPSIQIWTKRGKLNALLPLDDKLDESFADWFADKVLAAEAAKE